MTSLAPQFGFRAACECSGEKERRGDKKRRETVGQKVPSGDRWFCKVGLSGKAKCRTSKIKFILTYIYVLNW
jgi:hypothetical protein